MRKWLKIFKLHAGYSEKTVKTAHYFQTQSKTCKAARAGDLFIL
jgi:hypothetical protein